MHRHHADNIAQADALLFGRVTYEMMEADFAIGGILFGALPSLRTEFMKYPAVYRTQDDMKRVLPVGMIAILVAIGVLAVL